MKKNRITVRVDIPALGLKAGDPVEGPVADVLLANGKACVETQGKSKEEAGK